MRARVVHEKAEAAGVRLTEVFNRHLRAMRESEAADPEVQNRHRRQLQEAKRTGRLGPTLSFSGNEANPFFHRTAEGFSEIGTTLGLSRREDGRGFVLVDLNGDGALDVVHHNHFRNPIVALLNRVSTPNHWMRIRLRGTESNRFGIGARVTVAGRVRELQCGSGYLSMGPPELHFGLGPRTAADVEIRWPSGKSETYPALPSDRIYTLTEGRLDERRDASLTPHEIAAAEPSKTGAPEPDVRAVLQGLKDLDGKAAPVEGPGPRVVIFFSESCYACRGELLRQADLEREAAGLEARLVWVTTDSEAKHLKAQLDHIGATSKVYRPGSDLGAMPVPTVYLVDGDRVEKFLGRHAVGAALEAVRSARTRR